MANFTDTGPKDIWAVPLAVTDFNVIVALLGGFISLFGLVSYLLKENYYLSEACESRFCTLLLHFFFFGPCLSMVPIEQDVKGMGSECRFFFRVRVARGCMRESNAGTMF